jgi:hypothetical protein
VPPAVLILAVAVAAGVLALAGRSLASLRRDLAEGGVEGALRVVSGAQAPLTGKWRHGVVSPSPGALRFRPGGPAGLRFPRGRPFDVPVIGVSAEERSRPALRQLWTINPVLDVVQLSTATAVVELAVRPSEMDRVIAGLGRSADD